MKQAFFAIVNPAAGGGRCGRLFEAALDRVRREGAEIEVAQTRRAGEATEIARAACARGARNFLAVGGDGTAYEIVNGLFPRTDAGERPALGFLPLGTGNSFLRDFTSRGAEGTIEALRLGRRRACDVIRMRHSRGELYYINMLNLGFAADAGETANRRFKRLGQAGYVAGVMGRLARMRHQAFPHRLDGGAWDRRQCLFLAFGNSKFTGGKMMIAPGADSADGRIEYIRWAPIGRARLLWNFAGLFTGSHVRHPLATSGRAERVDFDLSGPANVIVDGEVMRIECRSLEVLPSALDVVV